MKKRKKKWSQVPKSSVASTASYKKTLKQTIQNQNQTYQKKKRKNVNVILKQLIF